MSGEAAATTEARHYRAARVAVAALLILAVASVTLITAGAFDPKPYGEMVSVEQPGRLTQGEAGESFTPLPAPSLAPPGRFSIRLTANHEFGEQDSGYGLAIGGDGRRLVVALSPLGYVTVREDPSSGKSITHMPWQTWPHVRPGTAANEIWLDMEQDGDRTEVIVWINRELLWRGAVDFAPRQTSLYQVSFAAPATVNFSRVEWFAEPAGLAIPFHPASLFL